VRAVTRVEISCCGQRVGDGPAHPGSPPTDGIVGTLKVRASIAIGHSSAGSSLTVAGDRVWAATDRGLVAVDSNTGKITSRIPLPGASNVAFDGSKLWALANAGVYSIRARTVTRRLPLSSQLFGLLVALGRDVWLSDEFVNSFRRVATQWQRALPSSRGDATNCPVARRGCLPASAGDRQVASATSARFEG
jgi:hypothetical protein